MNSSKKIIVLATLLALTPKPLHPNQLQEAIAETVKKYNETNKRAMGIVAMGTILACLGAYSIKKSIDIFAYDPEEKRTSFMKWLTKQINAGALGACGSAAAFIGITAALFSSDIARHFETQFKQP